MDVLRRLKKREKWVPPKALYLMGILIGGILAQMGGGIPIESILASASSSPGLHEVKPHLVQEQTQKNSSGPDNGSEELKTPNLPPPALDPEIVHEPPPNPHPEAVITPPKIDPDMAVHPRTLPGYPDNPNGETGKVDPGEKQGEKGSPPK